MPVNNFTSLTLKRKKICLQGLKPSHEYKITNSKSTVTSDAAADDEGDDEESVNPTAVGSGELSKTPQHQSSSNVNSVVVPSVVDDVTVGGSNTRISSSSHGFDSRSGSKSTPTVIEYSEEEKFKDGSNVVSPSTTKTEPSSSHSLYIIVGTISLFTTACILCFVKSYKKSRDTVSPNFE